jgi:hypothetical protein
VISTRLGYEFIEERTFILATTFDSASHKAQDVQDQYFRVTDQVPGSIWYWGAVASILVSATLFLAGKRDWSIFVGQWPPTFLLFGLFHKLLGSGH